MFKTILVIKIVLNNLERIITILSLKTTKIGK